MIFHYLLKNYFMQTASICTVDIPRTQKKTFETVNRCVLYKDRRTAELAALQFEQD